MDLTTLMKKNRPGVSLDLLKQKFGGLKDLSGNGQGMYDLLKHLMFSAGLNHIVQVNDCETSGDWTESDNGTFDYAVAATGKRVGTNCLSLTATAATDGTQYVQTKLINESATIPGIGGRGASMDWRDTDYIGFWKHAASSAHFGTAGELKFAIVNNGVVNGSLTVPGTAQAAISVGGTAGTVHHWCEIDLRNYARDKVEAIRFYGNNANTSEVTYIDDIIRYKLSYGNAPFYGCGYPITSGVTVGDGRPVAWSIDGLALSASAAAIADLGPAWLAGDASRVGTAKRNTWAMIPGCQIVLIEANAATTAGDHVEWAAVDSDNIGLWADVTTTATGKGVAIALEAAGAQYDWIFALLTKVGTSA